MATMARRGDSGSHKPGIWQVTADGMPGTGPIAIATVSRARAKGTGTPALGCAVAGLHDHCGGVRLDVMVVLAPALLRGRASAPGDSRIAPARRSCILVAHVTVAGERLGYICVQRVRLRPSLSWTFPPQNSRGPPRAAFFALGPISLPPLIRWLAGATPPLNWWG
jgi:hypothetical protein